MKYTNDKSIKKREMGVNEKKLVSDGSTLSILQLMKQEKIIGTFLGLINNQEL